jgi:hypothetical protein
LEGALCVAVFAGQMMQVHPVVSVRGGYTGVDVPVALDRADPAAAAGRSRVPLVAYVIIRALTGSSVGALAITDAVPSAWLLLIGIAHRRVEPIAVMSATTVIIAFAAYVLSSPTRPQPESSYSAPARSSRSNTSATRKRD